jgi:hypothetical protein
MADEFQVSGTNAAALFTLKIHRGEGMALLAMNWKKGTPPENFVGFGIEYKEPGGKQFFALKNRIAFPGADGNLNPNKMSTMLSPIQKFRWVHFPRNANLGGDFIYRVTPMFMNAQNELSSGDAQEAAIELRRETYPGKLNVAFTRGFVSSQAFVERYEKDGPISKLIPDVAAAGLKFKPTHPDADDAYDWMGFEAREEILATLDEAIKDKADVYAIAYDLNEPEVVDRFRKIGKRLKVIIDDSKDHKPPESAESAAERSLKKTAGAANVKRQHMSNLQHNKTIVVDGKTVKKVICGSTNLSWRGFFVQNNNAMVLQGSSAVKLFRSAFENYFSNQETFRETASAKLVDVGINGVNLRVAFSPHSDSNAMLENIADDISRSSSSLLYSLAFLYESPGAVHDAIVKVSKSSNIFVYGISDKHVGGLDLQKPDGNISPVFASALAKNIPAPFSKEPTGGAKGGGGGTRMHHKFVVIDFDKPTARVYFGSYNFSNPADLKNGENLLLVRDRRVAVSYMIEALRIFDHYHFRVAQQEAKTARKKLQLALPPRKKGEKPWWAEDYSDKRKIRDRELFA